MKKSRMLLVWICIVVLCMGSVSSAWAGDLDADAPILVQDPSAPVLVETPALLVTGAAGTFELPLIQETNGKWQWLQVPNDVPLTGLSLAYRPAGQGSLLVYDTFALSEGTLQAMQPLDPSALDFTDTQTLPYMFVVEDSVGGRGALWNGWLTVAHQEKPANLPEVPAPTPPPVTEPPVTEPPVTEPPITEPPITEPPVTEPPVTEPPTAPPVTDPPITPPPITPPPITPPPITQPPITQPPITQPPFPPWPTYPPVSETGYGLITNVNVNLRDAPNGVIRARLQYGDVLYINGQRYDQYGQAWHLVNVVEKGLSGYVHAGYARFMTEQEVYDYLNRPTPRPTPWITPTPVPSVGYARVTWQSTSLRSAPNTGATVLRTLLAGSVVYVTGQSFDGYGTRWFSVRPQDNVYGYLMASSVVMMTPQEVADYLESFRPTPRPTAVPTLNPNFSYAVVKLDNVNFRREPNGWTIRRVHTGTIARLLMEDSVYKDGYRWYFVQIDREDGYLREDMIDFIQIRPTATPTPRPTPTPTPSPTPSPVPTPRITPLPTAGPMSMLDSIRAAVDSARYVEFAQGSTGPVSYGIRDFDSDKLMELLLVTPQRRANGTYVIYLDAYKLTEGRIQRVASKEIGPVLTPSTVMQVVLLRQDGRELVYVEQHDKATGKTTGGQGMTLVEGDWVSLPLTEGVEAPIILLYASADASGTVTWEDASGLRDSAQAQQQRSEDSAAYAAIVQVLLNLLRGMSGGNG